LADHPGELTHIREVSIARLSTIYVTLRMVERLRNGDD